MNKSPDEVRVWAVWKRIRKDCKPVPGSILAYYHRGMGWVYNSESERRVRYNPTIEDLKPYTHFLVLPPPDSRKAK